MFLRNHRTLLSLSLGLALLGVLGLWHVVMAQSEEPAAGAGKAPFANAVDQRNEMIRELNEIRGLLKEQNNLLKQLVEKTDAGGKAKK